MDIARWKHLAAMRDRIFVTPRTTADTATAIEAAREAIADAQRHFSLWEKADRERFEHLVRMARAIEDKQCR